jgi:serine/threonine protein phosphatase PrpC
MLHEPGAGILAPVHARRLALLGRDYPVLGPVGVVRLPGAGALALSRGKERKPYRHVDPNEDGALLIAQSAGTLLAVADGYNGVAASERALRAVERAAAALLVPDPERFAAAAIALVAALACDLAEVGDSRTCLVVAALCGRRCHFASFGDSSLFRAAASGPVTQSNEIVLGPELQGEALAPLLREAAGLWLGGFERAAGERIALVTDGVTNFAPEPDALSRILKDAPSDAAAAREIARAALGGGAGDNVAVAVAGAD